MAYKHSNALQLDTTQGLAVQSCVLVRWTGRQVSDLKHLQTGTASFPNSVMCKREAFEDDSQDSERGPRIKACKARAG